MDDNLNSMDDNKKIFCSVCGAEMLMSSRYCMKCGALNYDHPSNDSMKKYIKKKRKDKKESLIKKSALYKGIKPHFTEKLLP